MGRFQIRTLGAAGRCTVGGSGESILERNLAALARTSRRTVERVRQAEPRRDIEFIGPTEDGAISAQIGAGAGARALASRRRPLDEARRLAESVDVAGAGCIAVAGFALGHHVAAVARRMQRTGVVVVFEPDVGLLRAVLERVDHSEWLRATNTAVLTDPEDGAEMSRTLAGLEPILALGVSLLEHPPSRERLGESAGRFYAMLTRVVEAVRTNTVTSLLQIQVTLRNLLMNLDHYARWPGIADLKDAAKGKPAIVVSAGPSLRRNIDALKDPRVRERFVIVAVQTVLRPLLAAGIRPHFVTALDYHEISRRFYEGLTAEAVEGITLVVEPKANPAILDAYPGRIRCVGDKVLDQLLGAGLRRERGTLTPGATVAHLAYYLARHMGCDPVVLVGQDLGFTDGQYYSAGAAIHEVWAGELNTFNTLEMLEWERIARMGSHLREATDVLGRPILTDEQMATYLDQFQRDFYADTQKGLSVIDATEGGVRKQYTTVEALRDVVERFCGARGAENGERGSTGGPGTAHPWRPGVHPLHPAADTPAWEPIPKSRVEERVREVRRGVRRVGELSRKAAGVLGEMLAKHSDQRRVNELIGRVEKIREEVTRLQPAFDLVQHLNQAGSFNRLKADRALQLDETLTPLERQKRQIERDLRNVTWLADAADELGKMLDDAAAVLAGRAAKQTREPAAEEEGSRGEEGGREGARPAQSGRPWHPKKKLTALVWVDAAKSGLGVARDLGREFLFGMNPLRMTLRRLAGCDAIEEAVLLTDDPERAMALAGGAIAGTPGLNVRAERVDVAAVEGKRRLIAVGRAWAESCWRGGLGNLSCYDEVFFPEIAAEVMGRLGLDAALFVGGDWCLLDPGLCDRVVRRHLERPREHRLTFAHAPPGIGGCVVARELAEQLARAAAAGAWPAASIGGLLGYLPLSPMMDPIGQSWCVAPEPEVRDSTLRFIPDSESRWSLLRQALGPIGETGVMGMEGAGIARIVREKAQSGLAVAGEAPSHTVLELCTGRLTSGRRAHWERGSVGFVERPVMSPALAERILKELAEGREDAAVTFGGAGDPLRHPEVFALVRRAKEVGIAAVHVRTDLLAERGVLDELLECGADLISVDLMADSREGYKAVMGIDRFEEARGNVEYLLEKRGPLGAGRGPWIVPRMTRCDSVYADVRGFYDRWIIAAGAAVIDPLPLVVPGNRIAPLPRPDRVVRRDQRRRMLILSDGTAPLGERDVHGSGPSAGNVAKEGVAKVWRNLVTMRRETTRKHGADHPRIQMAS